LIAKIIGAMPGEHRRFLMSFKRGEPDWTLLDIPAAADLRGCAVEAAKLEAIAGSSAQRIDRKVGKGACGILTRLNFFGIGSLS